MPLTEDDFQEHVAGRVRFGAIPFIDQEHVTWACIDLDVRNWGYDPDDVKVFEMINGIVERLALGEITAVVERSKGKGWHIWTFFAAPVKASDVRRVLRHTAVEAGARDEADLVCPRTDRIDDVGNGMWLPVFGGDPEPATRFYECDADTHDWVPAADQTRFVQQLIAQPTPGEVLAAAVAAIPTTRAEPIRHAPDDHPSFWILEELREHDIKLDALRELPDGRLNFRCPLHPSPEPRALGGSGVFFPTGTGRCSSAKCDRKWGSVREFIQLVRGEQAPKLRTLTAEEFDADRAPTAVVDSLVYRASTVLLTGASKAGKSWFAFQLGMCAVAGVPFLGLETVPVATLLCSLELSAGSVRDRMREISESLGLPMPKIGVDFHVIAPTASWVPSINLATHEGVRALRDLIVETRAELVILDTLYRFLPGVDPNDNGQMGEIFGRLNDLAQSTGAAVLILDHVGKGEQLGPVSHSALGASVKGGAARVIVALKRTSREDGGRWAIDVESHFGSWDEPIHYERPERFDGTLGGGCVLCSATEAHGLTIEAVHDLFQRFGEPDNDGHRRFASMRKLREALIEAKHATGNQDADAAIKAIERDFCAPESAGWRGADRPIRTSTGERRAKVFVLRANTPGGGALNA